MANAVLYNQGSHPAGALKSGTMSMNVSPSLNIGALKWRNGFENNNTWVIYSDTYSQGQATQGNALPTIWASTTFTDAGLLNLINVLPARAGQTPFTDVTAATSWLRSQGVYFLSNQNYPQIVTSGMTLLMDAGFSACYPNGGTSIYDVSGNDYVGNMINGPSWSNSGTTSFINFDGSDDYILVSNNADILSKTSYTKIAWFNASTFSTNNNIISGGNSGAHAFWLAGGNKLNAGHNGAWSTVQSTSTLSLNTWYYGAVTFDTTNGWKLYLNGVQESTNAGTSTFNGNGEILIGAYGNAANLFTGKIANSMVYNRVLSQSEILQNYYKGPIVTSGLTLALDAGNLVSYGGTGTSWKDLTSNANNATLINGPTYSSDGGGCIVFDGANDYANVPSPINTTTITMCCWIYLNSRNAYGGFIDSYVDQWEFITDVNGEKLSFILWKDTGGYNEYKSTDNIPLNQWSFVSCSISGTSILLTLDTKQYTYTMEQSIKTGANSIKIGASISGAPQYLNGKMATTYIYNRSLTYNELMQIYNAQRGRFGK